MEVPDAQELLEDAVAPEQVPAVDEDGSPKELGIDGELVSKQTLGNNLDQVDERQSFAATVKQNVQDDEFVDMKKMIDENPDKYSEGNVVKNEASEEEHLGFMDEEEIQPKQSAAMLE